MAAEDHVLLNAEEGRLIKGVGGQKSPRGSGFVDFR